MSAEFLIVQHFSDPFRREAKNVGVFVRMNGDTKARFFGEVLPGDIDGRRIRMLPFPDAYSQWINYWRRILKNRPGTAWDEAKNTAIHHYQVIDGGEVDRIGDDSIDDVLDR